MVVLTEVKGFGSKSEKQMRSDPKLCEKISLILGPNQGTLVAAVEREGREKRMPAA